MMSRREALRRVPLEDVDSAIRAVEEDGGVILTGFTTVEQLEQVAQDIEPHLRSNSDVCARTLSWRKTSFPN